MFLSGWFVRTLLTLKFPRCIILKSVIDCIKDGPSHQSIIHWPVKCFSGWVFSPAGFKHHSWFQTLWCLKPAMMCKVWIWLRNCLLSIKIFKTRLERLCSETGNFVCNLSTRNCGRFSVKVYMTQSLFAVRGLAPCWISECTFKALLH